MGFGNRMHPRSFCALHFVDVNDLNVMVSVNLSTSPHAHDCPTLSSFTHRGDIIFLTWSALRVVLVLPFMDNSQSTRRGDNIY
jgi:hypothetical protein